MSEINKAVLYEQFNTRELQAEEVISKYFTIESIKESLFSFIAWLKENGASPVYADFEGQSPFWEITQNNKSCYIVLNGTDNVCIMMNIAFSDEYQAVMRENNMQDVILNNLQYCSRKDGSHCSNCHLPPDVAGVDNVIFGKEISNLCCGQFISFSNPDSETVEGIKKLLEL